MADCLLMGFFLGLLRLSELGFVIFWLGGGFEYRWLVVL
jgi:hypothetical protein